MNHIKDAEVQPPESAPPPPPSAPPFPYPESCGSTPTAEHDRPARRRVRIGIPRWRRPGGRKRRPRSLVVRIQSQQPPPPPPRPVFSSRAQPLAPPPSRSCRGCCEFSKKQWVGSSRPAAPRKPFATVTCFSSAPEPGRQQRRGHGSQYQVDLVQ